MAYFDSDGASGTVAPVYLKVAGSSLLEIYPTSYHANMSNALLGSPSEDGVEWIDSKVLKPMTIQFKGIVKFPKRRVFHEIRANMRKHTLADIMCEFYSKAGYYQKMMVETLEEVGESTRYDGIEINVKLHEYLEHGSKKN